MRSLIRLNDRCAKLVFASAVLMIGPAQASTVTQTAQLASVAPFETRQAPKVHAAAPSGDLVFRGDLAHVALLDESLMSTRIVLGVSPTASDAPAAWYRDIATQAAPATPEAHLLQPGTGTSLAATAALIFFFFRRRMSR